ncbi:hypothetical protein ACHAQE_010092 [Botrytis cinerea]
MLFVFRNFSRGKWLASAEISEVPQATKIDIKVPRPWKIKAGQYIYLTIPAAGFTSAIQSHPFMIAWWVRNGDGLTISLLVKTRRGFTTQLSGLAKRPLTAFIDGPYGIEHELGEFGTVIMFATGIGIAAHMPYIKDLVSGYNSCEVRTHRILLVWQLEMESHQQWVKDWMDEVIEMDTGRILEIELYVLKRSNPVQLEDMDNTLMKHNLTDPKIVLYGTHQKIHKIFAPANVRSILNGEMTTRKGSLIVSACANKAMSMNIRNTIQQGMDEQMRFIELEFQPSLHSNTTSAVSDDSMDFACAGLA